MPDQDVFTLPTETTDVDAEAPAPKPKAAKKQAVDPLWDKPPNAEAKADDAPEAEAPEGPQAPHPAARLIQGQWLVKRRGKTFIARPAIVNGKPAPSSLYTPREFDAFLDDATPIIDKPGRLEAAIEAAGCRMAAVALYDVSPVDAEIERLRGMGLDAMADLLREKHPQATHAPYGALGLGRVMASPNLYKLGSKVTGEGLRGFLRRHANGDHGDRGKLAEVELDDDAREFPGAFGGAVMNAVSIERGWGLVWSTFSGAEIVADPQWRDERRLHVATILDGANRTYVWSNFDGISTN